MRIQSKWFIALLLLGLMLFGVATAEGQPALPQVGDELCGFVTRELMPVDALGATGVVFEHEKSGAKLLYLSTTDTNRSFDISFRTPALDDKGKPHVFEHMTICGSQKYPDANMFFPFVNQTYSTFVNACTFHGMTSYPVASLSEDQLMTMMDYYLSGVFTPYLYTEPKLVEREAWRYELFSADEPLNYAGTVYSEMQGAMTTSMQAYYDVFCTLFNDSPVAHVSGGRPEAIRTLTYDELIAFHDAYYHPSNALIILYGDMDYAKFMSWIDTEYLCKYDKKDINVEMGVIEPFTQTLYKTYDAAVEESAQTEDASYINYIFGMDDAELYDAVTLQVLTSVFSQDSSPLMRGAREKLPNATVSVSTEFDAPVPYLKFAAIGVNESDRDTFVSLVDDAIAEYAQNGIPADELESVIAVSKLSLLLTPEDQDLGVDASMNIALTWVYFDRLDYYNVYETVLDETTPEMMKEFLIKRLADNAYRAVSVTVPKAGLAEENAAALSAELEQKKASMSQSEIDDLVASSASFIEWSAKAVDTDTLAPILNVTVDTLPEESVRYEIVQEEINGIEYLTATADVGDVGVTDVLLDGSVIPIDQLQDVELCLSLLGNVNTELHTREELSPLMTRYLSGFSAGLSASSGYTDQDDLYSASLQWKGLSSDYEASVKLLNELFTQSQFTDIAAIRNVLVRNQTYVENAIDEDPLSIQMYRCYAALSNSMAYSNQLYYLDWYRYATDMIELADTEPEKLTARLQSAMALLQNKRGAKVVFAGNEQSIGICKKVLPSFFEGMGDEQREKVDYSPLRATFKREALINNSTVHMNVLIGKTDEYNGKSSIIASLISDMYMLPKLRNAMGAYGAYSTIRRSFTTLYTYRDPNLKNTLDVYNALPEYLRTAEITQDDVDRYIVGSYSILSRPEGKLSGAISALTKRLQGYPDDVSLQLMKEAKATTVEDVRNAADAMEALLRDGVYSSSGSQSLMDENAELFDSQVRLEDGEAEKDNAA